MSHGVAAAGSFMSIISVIIYAIMISPSVIGLYFAINDSNNSCQKSDRGGLNLSEWLEASCVTDLVMITLLYFTLMFEWVSMSVCESMSNARDCSVFSAIFAVVYFICLVVFRVWGIVLLATPENNSCVGRATDLGITALCYLVISSCLLSGGGTSAILK